MTRLSNNPWIRSLAIDRDKMDMVASLVGRPEGNQSGVVVSVDDPEERGRVKVIFDAMNPADVAEVTGAGDYSESREGAGGNQSHWLDTSPAFKGKQPPGLVDKRVNIAVREGQLHYAVLQDVIFDPQNLVASSAEKLKIPNNSTMTRLPIYPAGSLPPPCEENAGCIVIEEGGPMNSDWTCVCLRRDGKYIWVRHGDLAHGHAGGNDITSQVDSSGNRPGAGQVAAIWDHVFVTSHQEMEKHSAYGTNPRGNLLGQNATWPSPPNGVNEDGKKIEPLPYKSAQLFEQTAALAFVRETGYIPSNITGAFSTSFSSQIPSAVSSVPGYNFAASLIQKGQKALQIASSLGKILSNPLGTLKEIGTSVSTNYVTEASKAAVNSASNTQGSISQIYSSIKNALRL